MRNLFRSFERSGVEYLLISGQASILYGAALFSEDIDLWLRPTAKNVGRFLRVLAACKATVHKLTPPMTVRNLQQGHGFHFLLPSKTGPVYLDVMGQPPRVADFEPALARSRMMSSDWGPIPVAAIEDLIELKKTRRLNDYEVITNLVRIRMLELGTPTRRQLRWAARNSYRAEERHAYLRLIGAPKSLDSTRKSTSLDLMNQQKRDVAYWSRHLAQLRRWRRLGSLWPEGTTVASILRRPRKGR